MTEQLSEEKELFTNNCTLAESYIAKQFEGSDDCDLDTLVFLLRLVRARGLGAEETTKEANHGSRNRWTLEEDSIATEAYHELVAKGVIVRDELVEEVASRFPKRTLKSVTSRLYKLGLFQKGDSTE